MPGSPTLTLDLTELVLMHAAHLVHTHSLQNPEPVARVLNAAARSEVPNVTKRVLWDFSWITADTACKVGDIGLLKLLVDWSNTVPHDGGSSVRRPLEMTIKGIDSASANGHVHVLEYLFGPDSRLQDLEWSVAAMDEASANGHIACLDWWLRSGKELKYSARAMEAASASSNLQILDWWHKNVDCRFFFHLAIQAAARNGRTDILDWCFQRDLDRNDHSVVRGAARGGHAHVLEWLEAQDRWAGDEMCGPPEHFELEENTHGVMQAIRGSHAAVLLWYVVKEKAFVSESSEEDGRVGFEVSLTTTAIESDNYMALLWLHSLERAHFQIDHAMSACKLASVPVIEFVVQRLASDYGTSVPGLFGPIMHHWDPRNNLSQLYQLATQRGDVALLDWLLKSKCSFDNNYKYMEIASEIGRVDVLAWWAKYPGHFPRFTQGALVEASKRSHLKVLDWWKEEGWIQPANIDLKLVLCNSSRSSLEWWFAALGKSTVLSVGPLAYSEVTSAFDQVDSLDWWTNHGFPFECKQELVDDCIRMCNLSLLDWLHTWTKGTLECTELPLSDLNVRQQTLVVSWWASRGYPISMAKAHLSIHATMPLALLAKLGRSVGSVSMPTIDLDALSASGDVRGLQHALTCGSELVYTRKAVLTAIDIGLCSILDWWLNSELPLQLPPRSSLSLRSRWSTVNAWVATNRASLRARATGAVAQDPIA